MILSRLYRIRNPFKLFVIKIVDFIGYNFIFHPRPLPTDIKTILIIRNDNLGDLVLTLPLVDRINRLFPLAKLDMCAWGRWAAVVSHDARIRRFIPFESIVPSQDQYDVIIDMKGGYVVANKINQFIGSFIVGMADNGFGFYYDKPLFVPSQDPKEKIEEVLKALAKPDLGVDFPAKLNGYDRNVKGSRIVMAPFSSRAQKNWSNEKYLELYHQLYLKYAIVEFVGLTNQTLQFEAFPSQSIHLFQPKQLVDYIQYIADSELVIAPDSAPIHIAAALGVKSIALFGPENPEIWHPYKNSINVFIQKSKNVKDIEVSEVLHIVHNLLGERE